MEKYKNQDGISLNYTGKDSHQVLVRDVIREAIRIMNTYRVDSPTSMMWAMQRSQDFLRVNFNISEYEERSDEWRINQFNRNRAVEDQVSTIEEMEQRIKDTFDEME